jgi:hypothetical protein
MVVIGVDYLQTKGLGIAGTFFLADVILFQWIDIGIAIIYDGSYSFLHQTFNDGRRTRSATSMQQYFIGSTGNLYPKSSFHLEGEKQR